MLFFKIVLGAIGLGFRLLYHQIQFSDNFFFPLLDKTKLMCHPAISSLLDPTDLLAK